MGVLGDLDCPGFLGCLGDLGCQGNLGGLGDLENLGVAHWICGYRMLSLKL